MNEDKILLPESVRVPLPARDDLDDLIFQEESWLVSDR